MALQDMYAKHARCVQNELKTELYHDIISINISQGMANMNLNMMLTKEAKMALFKDNKERGWPSPS